MIKTHVIFDWLETLKSYFSEGKECSLKFYKEEGSFLNEVYILDLPALERLVNLMQDCDVSDDGISSTPHFDYKHTLPEALEIVKKECEEKEDEIKKEEV